jgi:lipoprotein-anchoring transpeptidase ErfK/SrfK
VDGPVTLRRFAVGFALLAALLEVAAVVPHRPDVQAAERSRRAGSVLPTDARPERALASAAARISPAGELAEAQRSPAHLLARIERSMAVFSRPGGRRVGTVPAASPFYREPTVAWVLRVSDDGRYGLVPIPYAGREATGWLRLRGLDTTTTRISVLADLSRHRLWVLRGDRVVVSAKAATGAPVSPTPTGRYTVSDLVPFPGGGPFGTFAFGLTGIQPNLPPGWTGGNQLAVHGTNDPSSIGRSVSAGCLRVSERVLDRLRRLLEVGTPVTVQA